MNEIDNLLTGNTCKQPCSEDRGVSLSLDPRYVRWEECAMMRSNFKNTVSKQFEKVDSKIDTTNKSLEAKIDELRTDIKINNDELRNEIKINNESQGAKLDNMNTNLIGVSNSMVIAAFAILGSVIVAFVGFYMLMK